MHIALDGGEKDLAIRARRTRLLLLRIHEWHEVGDGFFHDPGAFYHLRQKHLAGPEQVPDDVHPCHQWSLNHMQRLGILLSSLLNILLDVVGHAFHQCMGEALLDRA